MKEHHAAEHGQPYGRLLLMAGLHFAAMFALMYAMVDRFAYALPNLNQAYMAALMTSPMLIIELLLMGSMYPDKRWNLALLGTAAVVLATSFLFIRQQTGIGDREFLLQGRERPDSRLHPCRLRLECRRHRPPPINASRGHPRSR